MIEPQITIREKDYPFGIKSSIKFEADLPLTQGVDVVLAGEKSKEIIFRIFNNILNLSNITDAYNVKVLFVDNLNTLSQSIAPISQGWIYIRQYGYGEKSSGLSSSIDSYSSDIEEYSQFSGFYKLHRGSDGKLYTSKIRGSNNRVGFVELGVYVDVPIKEQTENYNFYMVIEYEYNI